MAYDWIEYFYLAQELSGMTPDGKVTVEAKERTAISRAYYTHFAKLAIFLEKKKLFLQKKRFTKLLEINL